MLSFLVEKYVKIHEFYRLLLFISFSTFIFLLVTSSSAILTILLSVLCSIGFLYIDGYIVYSYYMG